MKHFDRKQHWEKIYHHKELQELSWYQERPDTVLDFIQEFQLPLSAAIIDIGGGNSLLVDYLLDLGYHNVSVLDISQTAIEKAQKRLGEHADKVKWIVEDVCQFKPNEKYDFWYDRAAFHFLTKEQEILSYVNIAEQNIHSKGYIVVGTFSEQGPEKCSGIEIRQYSEQSLNHTFSNSFEKVKCLTTDHQTPSGNLQNFLFCGFIKK